MLKIELNNHIRLVKVQIDFVMVFIYVIYVYLQYIYY